jgi:predicted Zn-dependent protease
MTYWLRLVLIVAAFSIIPASISSASAQVLLRDAEIESWLEEMSEPLFDAAGLPEGSVDILLFAGPPNAFAGASNGLKMGVFTGLLTEADVPNEIEGVLAHEAGHLAGGHSARSRDAIAKASRPALLSLALGAALIIAGAPPEAGIGAVGLGQNIATANYLAYSRGQESAADQAAITYLDEVGSSSAGLIKFFGKLQNDQLITARRAIPYLQTHPLALQRVSALERRAQVSPYWQEEDSPEEIEKLRYLQAKIHGFIEDPHVALRLYPLSDQSGPARYARAVAWYRQSKLEEATREIDRLLESDPENPFFHELKGQMLFEHGKIEDAIAPHRRSVELAPEFALLRINLARALVATERDQEVEEAVRMLDEALRIEPDNSFAWTELARAQSLRGKEPLAMLAQAEANYHVGNPIDAHRFASLAKERLDAGTPEHQQAVDIIVATAEEAEQLRGRMRARRP